MHNNEEACVHVEKLAREILEKLCATEPAGFAEEIKRTSIRVLWDSETHDKYGEFFGVPEYASDGGNTLPPDIVLYARPLVEEFGLHGNGLIPKIEKVLFHEIGHFFGFGEEWLRGHGIA